MPLGITFSNYQVLDIKIFDAIKFTKLSWLIKHKLNSISISRANRYVYRSEAKG